MLTIPIFLILITSSRKYNTIILNWIDSCLPYCRKEYKTIAAHQNSAQSIEEFHHIPHWYVTIIIIL